MTYSIFGTNVDVAPGESKVVMTLTAGDAVSVFDLTPTIKKQIERGVWAECVIYRVTADGVEVLQDG